MAGIICTGESYKAKVKLTIEGEMEITIEDGKHYYELQYTLPDS